MWEQRLADAGCEPEVFREAVPEMRNALNSVGRAGFRQLAQARETSADTLILDYGLLPPGAYSWCVHPPMQPHPRKGEDPCDSTPASTSTTAVSICTRAPCTYASSAATERSCSTGIPGLTRRLSQGRRTVPRGPGRRRRVHVHLVLARRPVWRRHSRPTIRVWCSHRLRTLDIRSQDAVRLSAPSGAETTKPPILRFLDNGGHIRVRVAWSHGVPFQAGRPQGVADALGHGDDAAGGCFSPIAVGGAGCRSDERCGMVDRFMMPELERVMLPGGPAGTDRGGGGPVEGVAGAAVADRDSARPVEGGPVKTTPVEVEQAIEATAPLDNRRRHPWRPTPDNSTQ